MKRGEIWLISLDPTSGHEQKGRGVARARKFHGALPYGGGVSRGLAGPRLSIEQDDLDKCARCDNVRL